MKDKFEFSTDSQSATFCEGIAVKMVELFGITTDEAIGRLNQEWRGLSLLGPNDMIYHEDEEYWAKTIYYGKDSKWWKNPPGLTPKPFPK
jgi:hypothetical protein